jgi:hypothetical protein
MAFSTKITFVPRDSGEKSVSFDGVHYGLDNIMKELVHTETKDLVIFKCLTFREIGQFYYDYVTTLNFEEFLEFHPIHHKPSYLPNRLNEFLEKEVKKTRYNWVIIEVYEWESGLD